MGNFFSAGPTPTPSAESDSLSRNVTFSRNRERQDLPAVVTQTESSSSDQLKTFELLREDCNKLRTFIETNLNSLSPYKLLQLRTTLHNNEEKLIVMLHSLEENLETKIKPMPSQTRKSKSNSNPKSQLDSKPEVSALQLSESEKKFLATNNLGTSFNGSISIKCKLQSLQNSALSELDNSILRKTSHTLREWVEMDYEYNLSNQMETLNITGPFHTLLPPNYDDEELILMESDKSKNLRYFYKYLDYILNNSTGLVKWNGFIIKLQNNSNPSHNRIQIIDLDINPSRIIFDVKGYQRVRVVRSPKKLKIEGYDSKLIRKVFKICWDKTNTTNNKIVNSNAKKNSQLMNTMPKDLKITTPGNGTLILHFPQY